MESLDTRAKQAQNNQGNRVIRSEADITLLDRLYRRSARNLLLNIHLREQKPVLDELETAYQVCDGILALLQEDTIGEFGLKSAATYIGNTNIDSILEPFRDITKIFKMTSKRDLLFLMMSNCFNRADDLLESAFEHTKVSTLGAATASNFLEKVRISEYTNKRGENARVNFFEAVEAIILLAKHWNVDTTNWQQYVMDIVSGQLQGLELVKLLKSKGNTYSVDQAISYRKKTVGKYAQLLGNIGFGNNHNLAAVFYERMMLLQFYDDQNDILEDQGAQVNPFVSLLQEADLLDELKTQDPSNKNLSRFLKALRKTSRGVYQTLTRRIAHIKNAYLEPLK